MRSRPAPRVRVPVYMAAECGANREAVMLRYISAFSAHSREIFQPLAALRQHSPGLFLAGRGRRPGGIVEVAKEVRIRAQDHGPAAPESLFVGLHAPPEAIEIFVAL